MGGLMNPIHLIFIGIIALIFLGPKRLPELAKSLGSGMREFRETLNLDNNETLNLDNKDDVSPFAAAAVEPPPAPAPMPEVAPPIAPVVPAAVTPPQAPDPS